MTNTNHTFEGMDASALVAHLESGIAKLRAITADPVSLKVSDVIDIELRPSTEGERIIVGRKDWGYSSVNYIEGGVLLDVYAHAEMEPVHTASIHKDDIKNYEGDLDTNKAKNSNAQDFLELLARADSVEVDSSPKLSSWDTAALTGTPDNEIIHFTWTDEHGTYSAAFTEAGIENGKWVDNLFICEDSEGEETGIQLHRHIAITPKTVTAA